MLYRALTLYFLSTLLPSAILLASHLAGDPEGKLMATTILWTILVGVSTIIVLTNGGWDQLEAADKRRLQRIKTKQKAIGSGELSEVK